MTNRIDIANAFQQFDLSALKGEDKTKGVYFTEEYGFVVSKVFIAKWRHKEPVTPVFCHLATDDEDQQVTHTYPYKGMKKKSNRSHPLFSQTDILISDILKLFNVEEQSVCRINLDEWMAFMKEVSTKRERDRYMLRVCTKDEQTIYFSYVKPQLEAFFTHSEKEISTNFEKFSKKEVFLPVNLLLDTLQLSQNKTNIQVTISHDRIKLATDELEILLSTIKGKEPTGHERDPT